MYDRVLTVELWMGIKNWHLRSRADAQEMCSLEVLHSIQASSAGSFFLISTGSAFNAKPSAMTKLLPFCILLTAWQNPGPSRVQQALALEVTLKTARHSHAKFGDDTGHACRHPDSPDMTETLNDRIYLHHVPCLLSACLGNCACRQVGNHLARGYDSKHHLTTKTSPLRNPNHVLRAKSLKRQMHLGNDSQALCRT